LLTAAAKDVIYTDYFTGVHGNYLRQSIEAAGIDPAGLRKAEGATGYFGPASHKERPKNWKDIWAVGQGVGSIDGIPSVAALVDRLAQEYGDAARRIAALTAAVRS
jgi:nitronate monooxygenase